MKPLGYLHNMGTPCHFWLGQMPFWPTKPVATLTWPNVGVKPNTSKSWGFGVLGDSRIFRARQQETKHLALWCSWCHWKGLETKISKMASHWQFGYLQPKLGAKEGPRVLLPIWLPTTKIRESTSSRCPIRECDMALERSRRGLQLWFRPCCDPTLQLGVMVVQSSGSFVGTNSGLHFGSPGNLCHLDVASVASRREYYRE
jgi:hypothetical protein